MTLDELGWDAQWAQAFQPFAAEGLKRARVTEVRGMYRVVTDEGDFWATATGKLRHEAGGRGSLPAVGDWVALQLDAARNSAVVQAILPRRSKFSRKIAGEKIAEQVVAANIDQVWIVTSLDEDFSLRRLERYLALAWESGAAPIVILTKADLCSDVPAAIAEVAAIGNGVSIYAVSNKTGLGLDALRPCLMPRQTIALLGSSGVGKSTLVNTLAGTDSQRTAAVREYDSKGRHTTTHRQIIKLANGALIIDSPGMRELQLWEADKGIAETFPDIEALALSCKFTDCLHQKEPGCAVRAALQAGALDAKRLENYLKMREELRLLEEKGSPRKQAEARRDERARSKAIRAYHKVKGKK